MPEPGRRALGGVVAVCAGLLAPAGAAADAAETAAHRRLVAVMEAAGHRPAPFVTDGCSGGMSAAWRAVADLLPGVAGTPLDRPPWEDCCVVHDRAYHAASGAREAGASLRARLAADEALRACVRRVGARKGAAAGALGPTDAQVDAAYALIAGAMFRAVRLGGGPCSGLPWRWGYGYPDCSGAD